MKKTISLLLAMLFLITLIPTLPAATIVDSGACGLEGDGSNLTWTLDDEGTLTISGSGAMRNYNDQDDHNDDVTPFSYFRSAGPIKTVVINNGVTNIGENAFQGCTKLTNVMIPESVTQIGNYAFSICENLQSIEIPNGVTKIGNFAFAYCTNLTDVSIPDTATRLGKGMFYYCEKLTDATIAEGVTEISDDMFYKCYALTSVVIPDSVTRIGASAFFECRDLKNVTIPDGVTEIGESAFGSCWQLTEFTIPQGTTTIGANAFGACSGLTKITIPGSVATIGESAFSGCGGLTRVTIEEGVTSIESNAFDACKSLKEITIPGSVTAVGGRAFYNCKALTSATIGEGVTGIDTGAFSGCAMLADVSVPDSVTSIGRDAFADTAWFKNQPAGMVYAGNLAYRYKGYISRGTTVTLRSGIKGIADAAFYDCKDLAGVTIPDGVTRIGVDAFCSCEKMQNVSIPESVTFIGKWAFYHCKWLSGVTLPAGLTEIGEDAFRGCESLTEVNIPKGVTAISDGAFADCKGLTGVTIQSGVTRIGNQAFIDCANLADVTIPDSVTSIGKAAFLRCDAWLNAQPDGVVYAGKTAYQYKGTMPYNTALVLKDGTKGVADWAFQACRGITSLTIPTSVTSIGDHAFSQCSNLSNLTIPTGVTSIGEYAFSYCDALSSISLPNSVTTVGICAFSDCGRLASVTLPEGMTTVVNGMFMYCDNLTSVTLPEHSLTTVCDSAFAHCKKLESITLPDSLTAIDDHAFTGCESLAGVTIPEGVTHIGHAAFHKCFNLTSVTIPESMKQIGLKAFDSCKNLQDVYYGGSPEAWALIEIDVANVPLLNATLHFAGEGGGTIEAEFRLLADNYYVCGNKLYDEKGGELTTINAALHLKNVPEEGTKGTTLKNICVNYTNTIKNNAGAAPWIVFGNKTAADTATVSALAPNEERDLLFTLSLAKNADPEGAEPVPFALTAEIVCGPQTVKASRDFSVTPLRAKWHVEAQTEYDNYAITNEKIFTFDPDKLAFTEIFVLPVTVKITNAVNVGAAVSADSDLWKALSKNVTVTARLNKKHSFRFTAGEPYACKKTVTVPCGGTGEAIFVLSPQERNDKSEGNPLAYLVDTVGIVEPYIDTLNLSFSVPDGGEAPKGFLKDIPFEVYSLHAWQFDLNDISDEFGIKPYGISSEYLNGMLGLSEQLDYHVKQEWEYLWDGRFVDCFCDNLYIGDTGLCNGFATSAALSNDDGMYSTFASAKIGEIPVEKAKSTLFYKTDTQEANFSAFDYICYAHCVQFRSEVVKQRAEHEKNYIALVSAVHRFEKGGDPVLICIKNTHAIYAIKMLDDEHILVYDGNNRYHSPTDLRVLTLLRNSSGAYCGWDYGLYIGAFEEDCRTCSANGYVLTYDTVSADLLGDYFDSRFNKWSYTEQTSGKKKNTAKAAAESAQDAHEVLVAATKGSTVTASDNTLFRWSDIYEGTDVMWYYHSDTGTIQCQATANDTFLALGGNSTFTGVKISTGDTVSISNVETENTQITFDVKPGNKVVLDLAGYGKLSPENSLLLTGTANREKVTVRKTEKGFLAAGLENLHASVVDENGKTITERELTGIGEKSAAVTLGTDSAALTVSDEKPVSGTPGDVDGDGKITASDARYALRAAVGLDDTAAGLDFSKAENACYIAADVDGTPGITAADARLILRAAVGLEELK